MRKISLVILIVACFAGSSPAQNSNPWPTSGNVGIGTTSPANLLEVYTGTSSKGIQVYGSNAPFIQIQETNYPTVAKWINNDGYSTLGTTTNHPLVFNTNSIERFRISENGNTGIGSTSPGSTLEVGTQKVLNGNDASSIYTEARVASGVTGGFTALGIRTVGLAGSYSIANAYGLKINDAVFQSGVTVAKSFGIYIGKTTNPVSGGTVTSNYAFVTEPEAGNVGIGTTTPDSKLTVAGDIHSREVKVTANAGADFVFEDDYKLRSLAETEAFIKQNKHLPEIAPAKEMVKDGVNLGEMNIKLLQKIEELTLHVIELNKKVEQLETRY